MKIAGQRALTAYLGKLGVVLMVVALVAALLPTGTSTAQEGSLTAFTTSTDFLYSDRLVFRIEASANATLSGARLTVQVKGSERIFSEVVELTPGSTISASHEMTVDALSLPPFAEITYYWEFEDQNGVSYRTSSDALWYEDTNVPWEWQEVIEADITVLTNGRNESISAATLDLATQSLTAAERMLGTPFDGQMRIYVYPDLAAMANALRAHNLQIEDWVAAYSIPSQQLAIITASEGLALADTLQRDVPHEVSHLVLAQVAGDATESLPGWFNEGMALNASGVIDPDLRTVLAEAKASHRLLPMADLCAPQFNSLPPQSAELAYAQSASFFQFVSERYGQTPIRSLLQALRNGASCEGAINQSLGFSLAQLESQWHNSTVEQTSADLPASGSVTLWFIVWVISAGLALLFLAPQKLRSQEAEAQSLDGDRTGPLKSTQRPDIRTSH